MITKVFFDTETTGLDYKKHSIHELGLIVEVDGEIKETLSLHVRPHPKALIDDVALRVAGVSREQILAYPPMDKTLLYLIKTLKKYIDPFEKTDKAWLIGFNNRAFDDHFFRTWFELCGNSFFYSYFWPNTIDVMVLASQYLLGDRRKRMPSFQLHRVAYELGLVIDESKTHQALYDAEITRSIYRITAGLEIEL